MAFKAFEICAGRTDTNRQTSARTGKLLSMGKGFQASHGVLGLEIGDLIMLACQKKVCLATFLFDITNR